MVIYMQETTTVKFEIEGIVPLKMDRFAFGLPDAKTPEEYQKQAEEKCYRDEKGDLAIPTDALKAIMRLASSDLGKKMEGKKNRQLIASGVFFADTMLSIGRKNHDGIAQDVVTRKGTGDKVTRVVSYRPLIKGWKVSGTMQLYGVNPQFAQQCLELGGQRYGLLGHRPSFGRFIVKKFEKK
jgi:hypothetical protein